MRCTAVLFYATHVTTAITKPMRLLLACLMTTCLLGCGERQPTAEPHRSVREVVDYPAWVGNPFSDGQVGAVGVSLPAWVPQEAIDRALANGRAQLAATLNVRIQRVFTRYLDASGGLPSEASRSISRSVSDQIMTGSHQRAIWTHPGTRDVYVWVVLDPHTTRRMISETTAAAREALHAEAYLRAERAAADAEHSLDQALEREVAGPDAPTD